ncbi:MAG: hypothetical protein JW832_15565 [Deltaproteobacteria bacterium]|nr:hypothetical protein [Deltaproteobacteria bacterium]
MKRKPAQMFLVAAAVLVASISSVPVQAQTWQPMTSGTTNGLNGIWGSSGSDVFAVGDGGVVVHYDGSAWSPMSSGTTATLRGVWGSSGSDVFAVGGSGVIVHYDGSSWSSMTSNTTVSLNGISGFGASVAYAVGDTGLGVYYNGSTWNPGNVSSGGTVTANMNGIWHSAPDEHIAVGASGIIYERAPSMDITIQPVSVQLNCVWGIAGSAVFAAGANGAILRQTGWATWAAESSGTTNTLYGVWGSSGADFFAVGQGGAIVHYDGSSWSGMTSNATVDLHAVWGSAGSDVFAVGQNGTILYYTTGGASTTTTTIDSTTTTSIRRLCPFRRSAATDAGVQTLRDLRDSQLETAFGAVIASMYYQNMDEIGDILQDSRALRNRFNRLTKTNMPAVRELMTQGTATIEADDLLEMHEFLTDLQGRAGMQLRMDIDFILRGMESGWLLQWLGITVE